MSYSKLKWLRILSYKTKLYKKCNFFLDYNPIKFLTPNLGLLDCQEKFSLRFFLFQYFLELCLRVRSYTETRIVKKDRYGPSMSLQREWKRKITGHEKIKMDCFRLKERKIQQPREFSEPGFDFSGTKPLTVVEHGGVHLQFQYLGV